MGQLRISNISGSTPTPLAGETVLYSIEGEIQMKSAEAGVVSTKKAEILSYAALLERQRDNDLEQGKKYQVDDFMTKNFLHAKEDYDEDTDWTREYHTASAESIEFVALSSSTLSSDVKSVTYEGETMVFDTKVEGLAGRATRTQSTISAFTANALQLDYVVSPTYPLEISMTYNGSSTLEVNMVSLSMGPIIGGLRAISLVGADIIGTFAASLETMEYEPATKKIFFNRVSGGLGMVSLNILDLVAYKEETPMTGKILKRTDASRGIEVGIDYRGVQTRRYKVTALASETNLELMPMDGYVSVRPTMTAPMSGALSVNPGDFEDRALFGGPFDAVKDAIENLKIANVDASIINTPIKNVEIKELKASTLSYDPLCKIQDLKADRLEEVTAIGNLTKVEIKYPMKNSLMVHLEESTLAATEMLDLEMSQLRKSTIEETSQSFKSSKLQKEVLELRLAGRMEGNLITERIENTDVRKSLINNTINASMSNSRLVSRENETISIQILNSDDEKEGLAQTFYIENHETMMDLMEADGLVVGSYYEFGVTQSFVLEEGLNQLSVPASNSTYIAPQQMVVKLLATSVNQLDPEGSAYIEDETSKLEVKVTYDIDETHLTTKFNNILGGISSDDNSLELTSPISLQQGFSMYAAIGGGDVILDYVPTKKGWWCERTGGLYFGHGIGCKRAWIGHELKIPGLDEGVNPGDPGTLVIDPGWSWDYTNFFMLSTFTSVQILENTSSFSDEQLRNSACYCKTTDRVIFLTEDDIVQDVGNEVPMLPAGSTSLSSLTDFRLDAKTRILSSPLTEGVVKRMEYIGSNLVTDFNFVQKAVNRYQQDAGNTASAYTSPISGLTLENGLVAGTVPKMFDTFNNEIEL